MFWIFSTTKDSRQYWEQQYYYNIHIAGMSRGYSQLHSTSFTESEVNDYSQYAREFRRVLLSHKDSGYSHNKAKDFLKGVFKELDGDNDGNVSVDELRQFIHSLHVEQPCDARETANSDKFAEVLVSQIDINHDGFISYHEMDEFLWPKVESGREVGVILDLMHSHFEACIKDKTIQRALYASSDTNDRILIDAFAKHINMKILRGNLIEVRALRHALLKLNGLGVGTLSEYEVDTLIESLDTNQDGVVSPREFRAWMFIPSRLSGDLADAASSSPASEQSTPSLGPDPASGQSTNPSSPGDHISTLAGDTRNASPPVAPAAIAAAAPATTSVEQSKGTSAGAASHTHSPPTRPVPIAQPAPPVTQTARSSSRNIPEEDVLLSENGQARRRAALTDSSKALKAATSTRTNASTGYYSTDGSGSDRDCSKDRSSPVTESSHLLSSTEEGDAIRRVAPTSTDDTCNSRNWGLVLVAAVFVVSFYVIASNKQ